MSPLPPSRVLSYVIGIILLVGAVLIIVGLATRVKGAQGAAVLDKPQLAEFTGLPLYDPAGNLKSFHITTKWLIKDLQPDGKTVEPKYISNEFDLIRQGGQTVVLGNSIAEFADIADDLLGVSEFAWKLSHPDALPQNPPPMVRRKSLRKTQ